MTLGSGASATLRAGRFLPIFDLQRDIAAPEMNIELSPRDKSVPPLGLEMRKTCRPSVVLRDGEAAHDYKSILRKRPPARGILLNYAYYGRNCGLDWNKANFMNDVVRKCGGKVGCSYDFTWATWGRDPSPSLCTKEIDIAYQCAWDDKPWTVKVKHQTTPQRVELRCN